MKQSSNKGIYTGLQMWYNDASPGNRPQRRGKFMPPKSDRQGAKHPSARPEPAPAASSRSDSSSIGSSKQNAARGDLPRRRRLDPAVRNTRCWVDHFARPALQGRVYRHFGPAEIVVNKSPTVTFGSMIVGPAARVEGMLDDRVIFTLHASEIVPNLARVKGMAIAHRIRIVSLENSAAPEPRRAAQRTS